MKLPLAGQAYQSPALAVAAQECVNFYPEMIDDPEEQGKSKLALCSTPGNRSLYDLAQGSYPAGNKIRGLWSAGGTLYAVAGTTLYGWKTAGNPGLLPPTAPNDVVNLASFTTAAHPIVNSGNPVQMFGNGDQLFIVMDGWCFLNNGPGDVYRCCFNRTGTGSAGTGSVFIAAGAAAEDKFDSGMVGRHIVIAGNGYKVAAYTDPTHITLDQPCSGPAGSVWVTSTAADPVPASSGAYLDGFFIVAAPDSNRINISAINNGLSWDAADFALKEAYPDVIMSLLTDHEQLYVFGTESSEVWQNTGNANFPFQRFDGAATREGSSAQWAPVALPDTIAFLGGSPRGQTIAYRLNGYTPVRISTHAIERQWTAALKDAGSISPFITSYSVVENGHVFWQINFNSKGVFPAVDALGAWLYDHTLTAQLGTPMWHRRAKWVPTGGANPNPAFNGSWQPYPHSFHTFLPEFGLHVTGDAASGKLYVMSSQWGDEDLTYQALGVGAKVKRQRALPYVYAGGKRQFFGRLEVEMQTATAITGTPEPVIVYDYSDSRGADFRAQRARGYGSNPNDVSNQILGLGRRVFWERNGSSFGRIHRFTTYETNPVTLVSAECEVTIGR